jgi:cystathionine gamma-lyase
MSLELLLNDPVVLNGAKPKPVEDSFGTRAIRVGSEPDVEAGAVIPLISLLTMYKQEAVGVRKVRDCSLLYSFGGIH